jgi:hypothetical protein
MKGLIFLVVLISSNTLAHESEELITLRATNDVLNFRVAQLLEENARLQTFADKPLNAQAAGETVNALCDHNELRSVLIEGSGRQFNATDWLRKNAEKCSKADLQYIALNIHDWTSYAMYEAIRLARFYADQK